MMPEPDEKPRRRRVARVALAAGLILLILIVSHPIWLSWTATFLIVDDPPVQSDLIVALGGHDRRIMHALKLYKLGWGRSVLVSLPDENVGDLLTTPEIRRRRLLKVASDFGIAPPALIVRSQARSTYDEAVMTRKEAARMNARSVVVVSSAFHTRRVRLVFRKVLAPAGVRVHVCAVPLYDEHLSLRRWWTREAELVWVFMEYCKLALYCFKYRLWPIGG